MQLVSITKMFAKKIRASGVWLDESQLLVAGI
jgi:hypothetical protein